MPIGGGGASGRWVVARTEADAKSWLRYMRERIPKRRRWGAQARRVWAIAFGALLAATILAGVINAAG